MNFSQVWSTPWCPCVHGTALHSPSGGFYQHIQMSESQTKQWRKSKGMWLTQEQVLHSPHTAAFPAGMSRIGMNHKFLIHCKTSQLADTEGFALSTMLTSRQKMLWSQFLLVLLLPHFFLLTKQQSEANRLISGNIFYIFQEAGITCLSLLCVGGTCWSCCE